MIYSEWHWTLDSLCNFLQCEWVSPILQTVVVQEVGSHPKIIDRLIVSTQLASNALPQQGYFYISKKKTSLWRKHKLEPPTLTSLWNLWAISVFKGRGHLRIVPYIQDLWWLYDEKDGSFKTNNFAERIKSQPWWQNNLQREIYCAGGKDERVQHKDAATYQGLPGQLLHLICFHVFGKFEQTKWFIPRSRT